MDETSSVEVITMFHSMLKTKNVLSDALEQQYFLSALAEYELTVNPIGYDPTEKVFQPALSLHVIYTLALMMYTRYLTQELSRVLKLNGIAGKDITLTGIPASKTQTLAELQSELTRTKELLYKQMPHCFA